MTVRCTEVILHVQIAMVGKSVEPWTGTARVAGKWSDIRQGQAGATWKGRCGRRKREERMQLHREGEIVMGFVPGGYSSVDEDSAMDT